MPQQPPKGSPQQQTPKGGPQQKAPPKKRPFRIGPDEDPFARMSSGPPHPADSGNEVDVDPNPPKPKKPEPFKANRLHPLDYVRNSLASPDIRRKVYSPLEKPQRGLVRRPQDVPPPKEPEPEIDNSDIPSLYSHFGMKDPSNKTYDPDAAGGYDDPVRAIYHPKVRSKFSTSTADKPPSRLSRFFGLKR